MLCDYVVCDSLIVSFIYFACFAICIILLLSNNAKMVACLCRKDFVARAFIWLSLIDYGRKSSCWRTCHTRCEIFHLIILECEHKSLMWVLGWNHVQEELLPCRAARELASGSSLFPAAWLARWPPDGTAVKRGHSSPLSCSWSSNTQHPSSTLWRPTLFFPLDASSHLRRGRWEN